MKLIKPKFRVGQVVGEKQWNNDRNRYVVERWGKVLRIYWDADAGSGLKGGFIIEASGGLTETHESWFRPLTKREMGQ